jgi:hypothetical protein
MYILHIHHNLSMLLTNKDDYAIMYRVSRKDKNVRFRSLEQPYLLLGTEVASKHTSAHSDGSKNGWFFF